VVLGSWPRRASSDTSSLPGHRPTTRIGALTTTTVPSATRAAGWSTSTALSAPPRLTAADNSRYDIDEAEVMYRGRCPECFAVNPVSTKD
jgi:hypothetical protein